MQNRFGLLAAFVVTTVACRSDTQASKAADTAASAATIKKDSAVAPAASAPATNAPVTWTMKPGGIGPLHAGMDVIDAKFALNGFFTADSSIGCREQALHGAPGKVTVTVVDGLVGRFDTKDSTIVTELGARVGDTEARIESLYAGHLSVQPHKYLEKGHYLVVTPTTPGDANNRLIFETDGSKVLEYRAGALPAVSFVEHCG